VKVIFPLLAITAIVFLAGCGFWGTNEEVKQQPRKAIFKSAEEDNIDNPTPTPPSRKVPGE
jgi:hypothetical protein